MKKTLIISGIAAGLFISCKKNYTCDCTTTVVYYGSDKAFHTITANGDATPYTQKMTEKQARSACEREEQVLQSSMYDNLTWNGYYKIKVGESVTSACTLK